jgi:CRISPR system Cascade subunit CasD
MSFLFLRLTGPLQSWGTMECNEHRHTGPRPSKAGVLGLIAAALGIARGSAAESAWLPEAACWPMTTWQGFKRFTLEGKEIPSFQPVLLEDFQTVPKTDSRFLPEKPAAYKITSGGMAIWRVSPRPKALSGSTSRYTDTPNFIARKTYLADADFVVCFEIADSTAAQEALAALLCPVWMPYLGRKSCPPSQPVAIGLLNQKPAKITHGDQVLALSTGTAWSEIKAGGTETASDVPMTFDPKGKCYSSRSIEVIQPAAQPEAELSEWYR